MKSSVRRVVTLICNTEVEVEIIRNVAALAFVTIKGDLPRVVATDFGMLALSALIKSDIDERTASHLLTAAKSMHKYMEAAYDCVPVHLKAIVSLIECLTIENSNEEK